MLFLHMLFGVLLTVNTYFRMYEVSQLTCFNFHLQASLVRIVTLVPTRQGACSMSSGP